MIDGIPAWVGISSPIATALSMFYLVFTGCLIPRASHNDVVKVLPGHWISYCRMIWPRRVAGGHLGEVLRLKFIEQLRARGEHEEVPPPPWYLHDKLKCYDFCEAVGLPTVRVLKKFAHPSDITLDGLPDEFVLKPAYHSSSIGVMVLARKDDDVFFDAMTKKDWTFDQIMEHQLLIHDDHPRTQKFTIVEEKIQDLSGKVIPDDFKAYAFHGDIALILQIDRNGGRPSLAWYDGDFMPVTDDRVWTNEKYFNKKEHDQPADWDRLLDLARRASLATPTAFGSFDMYSSTRGPLLGEVTLVPGGFYFGKYFVPSQKQDMLMGQMWERALIRLGRSPLNR